MKYLYVLLLDLWIILKEIDPFKIILKTLKFSKYFKSLLEFGIIPTKLLEDKFILQLYHQQIKKFHTMQIWVD
jgi:hypothetical protein